MDRAEGLTREDFEDVLGNHQELIHLANDLEYQLYHLGASPTSEQINECQQAAGALIRTLRQALFHQDQRILPVLESLIGEK
jgi:hypothetical protein